MPATKTNSLWSYLKTSGWGNLSLTPSDWEEPIGKIYREGRRLKVLKYSKRDKFMLCLCLGVAGAAGGAGAAALIDGHWIAGPINMGLGFVNYIHFCHGMRSAKKRMLGEDTLFKCLEALKTGKYAFPKLLMEAVDNVEGEMGENARKHIIEAYFTGIAKKKPND